MREWGIPLREVACMAVYLPPDSAVGRAMKVHPQQSLEVDLLRALEFSARAVVWQNGGGVGAAPEPIPLPWDEPPTEPGDALEWGEAVEALGGDPRFAAVIAALEEQMGGGG